MKWEKLGLVFHVNNNFNWMRTHAALPIPTIIKDNIFRIFFSTRDEKNCSHGAFVDININKLSEILNISSEPVLSPGKIGLFDDNGVSLSSYCHENGLFYYLGWNLMQTVPFSNKIGAAKLSEKKFTKIKRTPIIQICEQEPFSFGYPFVIKNSNFYKMWYDTNMFWESNSTNDYFFVLRSATSTDGINWDKDYIDCLKMNEGEKAISRPCVIKDRDNFKMWYSINFEGKYRIGYAESIDGNIWTRKDNEVGITVSESGWDSDEIEYPYVFDHAGERYMLYNGNGYGRTGFGLARMLK